MTEPTVIRPDFAWAYLVIFAVMAIALCLKAIFIYKLLVMGLEDRKFRELETQRVRDIAAALEKEVVEKARIIKNADDETISRVQKQLTTIDSNVKEGIDVARAAAAKSAEAVDVANHVNEKIEETNKNIEATLKHLDQKKVETGDSKIGATLKRIEDKQNEPVDVRVVNEPLAVEQANKK